MSDCVLERTSKIVTSATRNFDDIALLETSSLHSLRVKLLSHSFFFSGANCFSVVVNCEKRKILKSVACSINILIHMHSCWMFIHTCITKYLHLYHKMAAFRKQHSCETTLIRLTEDWKSAADRKECVTVLSTDMSKAFDSLHSALMIQKLKAYGFWDETSNLMRSFYSLEETE